MFDPEIAFIVGVICAVSREIRAWYLALKKRRPPNE